MAFGPAGWLAAGVIALGSALAINGGPIKKWFEAMRTEDWNKDITEALAGAMTAIKAGFQSLGAAIMDALKGMWKNMKKELGGPSLAPAAAAVVEAERLSARAIKHKALYAGLIRHYGGDEVENLLKIYGTEGASSYTGDYVNGVPTSFGPFQLHKSGMYDVFKRDTGLDASDPSTVADQVKWMVN